MARKTSILNHTSLIVLTLSGAFLLAIIAGLVYPYKTIEFSNFRVVGTINRNADVGRLILISWSFNKHIPMPANYTINLIPEKPEGLDNTYLLESGTVNSPVGRYCTSKLVKVSEEINPGTYRVRMSVEYHVNIFRSIVKTFNSENTLTIK